MPPFDPTVARPERRPLPRKTTPTPKPILASDCLRDDEAPIEPSAHSTRSWCIGLGVAIVVVSLAMLSRGWPLESDFAPMRSIAAASTLGILAAGFALGVRRYALRGAFVLVTALVGTAALLIMHRSGVLLYLRWLAPTPLVAALFLRVSYRSDPLVRAMLGVSIVLFLLAACFVGGSLVFAAGASPFARAIAASMVVVSGLALLGFMGEETTAGCTVWASLGVSLGACSIVIDALVRSSSAGTLTLVAAALAMPIAACGTFQLMATFVGPRLRAHPRISLGSHTMGTSRTSMPPASGPHDLEDRDSEGPRDSDEQMLPADD